MKQILIYLDILGYEDKAKKESESVGRPVEDIRRSYIDSIVGRLEELKNSGVISSYCADGEEGFHDDFLVLTNNIRKAFKTVGDVLKAGLPLEIGIGIKESDNSYLLGRSDETVSHIKTHIIPKYRNLYKKDHEGRDQIKLSSFLHKKHTNNLIPKRCVLNPIHPKSSIWSNRKNLRKS